MLQQNVTNLEQENSNLLEKTRKGRHDLEKYCKENEQYGPRLCLRIKNIKKQQNESYGKVLEAVQCLLSEASINIPDPYNDRAHCVSRTGDTMIVRFTTFRNQTIIYRKMKELKYGVKVHLD